jgi:hypothetical protein
MRRGEQMCTIYDVYRVYLQSTCRFEKLNKCLTGKRCLASRPGQSLAVHPESDDVLPVNSHPVGSAIRPGGRLPVSR